MVDNVNISAGTGTAIWTDEVTGAKHAQFFKLADGTADSTVVIPGDAVRGLHVLPSIITRLSQTPTISAAAVYAAGDAVGGLLTFANAARYSGGGVSVKQVVIIDKDQEMAPLDLVLFDRTFTNSADNAAFDPTDADLANLVTVIPIARWINYSDNAVGLSDPLDIPIKLNGTSLFGQLVTRGEPTYTATSDIIVLINAVQE